MNARALALWLLTVVGMLSLPFQDVLADNASLSVTMTAPGTADLNQPIDYSVSVINASGGATTVTDLLPQGMSFVSSSGLAAGACSSTASGSQSLVTCDLGTLAAGNATTFLLTGKVTALVNNVNPVVNSATAKSGSVSATSSSVSVTINTQAALTLTINGPASQVAVGDPITYQLHVVNTSAWVSASNVVVYDTLPAGVSNVTYPASCSAWAPGNGSSGVQCTVGTVAPGANSSISINVNAPTQAATIVDQAQVQSSNAPTQSTSLSTPVGALADLGIAETAPATIPVNSVVTYNVIVTNYNKYVSANNVSVTISLPFHAATATSGCTIQATSSVCSLGTVAPGQTVSLVFTGTVSSVGTVTSTSQVTTTTGTAGHHAMTSTANTLVTNGVVGPTPLLSVTLGSGGTWTLGSPTAYMYSITVVNQGYANAVDVTAQDTIPATFNYDDFCSVFGGDGTGTCTYNPNGSSKGSGRDFVTWTVHNLAPGQKASMYFTVRPQALTAGPVYDTVTASSPQDPTSPHSATSGLTVIPPAGNVTLGKYADNTYALLHSLFDYHIDFANNKGVAVNAVTVVDPLPSNVSFSSATVDPGVTCTDNRTGSPETVTCQFPSVAALSSTGMRLTVHANVSGQTHNVASASSPDFTTIGSQDAAVIITAGSNLKVSAVNPQAEAARNATVSYTLQVANLGPDVAQTATLKPTVPAGWSVTSFTSTNPGANCSAAAPPTCSWPTIPSGATYTAVLTVKTPSVAPQTVTPWTAAVANGVPDNDLSNNNTSWTTVIVEPANISINQNASIVAAVGTPISWAILASNQDSDALNTVVKETLQGQGGAGAFNSVSWTAPGGTCSYAADNSNSSGVLTCTYGTIPATGSNTRTITMTLTPLRTGTITSTAVMTADNAPSAESSISTISAELATTLSINLTATPTTTVHGTIGYTMLVSNTGRNPANSVVAKLTLDSRLGAPTSMPNNCSYASHVVTCSVGTIAAGASPTSLVINVSPTTAGTYISTAAVTTSTLNQSSQINQSAQTVVTAGIDLSVQETGPSTQNVSRPIVYRILATNTDTSTSDPSTVVTDALPAGSTLVSATTDTGSCSNHATNGITTVQCALGTLAPQQSANVTITIQAGAANVNKTIVNTVSVAGGVTDPSMGNNQSSVSTTIVPDTAPTITSLTATPNPVTTGTTSTLNAVATDAYFASTSLTYHWTLTSGPSAVTFSNTTTSNAAHQDVATFTSAGTFHFAVTVTNPGGVSTQGTIVVTVQQGFGNGVGSIVVSPNPGSVGPSQHLTFTATAYDQFSKPLLTQPTFVWAASAGGSINPTSGVFTAGNVPGTYNNAVSASAQGDTGKATVLVLTDKPAIVSATANPNPVTTTTSTSLAALGSDTDYPESVLTYHWSTTNSNVTLANTTTTNAAKNTTATFTQAGSYVFTVTVTNPTGASVQAVVHVAVDQGFGHGVGSIVILPNPGSVGPAQHLTFTATAYDQFGKTLTTQPAFAWGASSGGSINAATGVFTAGNTPGTFSDAITASASGDTGAATVTVLTDKPTLVSAKATPNPVTTTTSTSLAAVASDADYAESLLTYHWSTTNSNVTLANTGSSNAAKNTTASFTQAGSYSFTITVTNPTGASVTGTVNVTVDQGFGNGVGSILISPNPGSVAPSQHLTFTATAYDQFVKPLAHQPTFTWAASAGGSIVATSGVFSAGNTPGTFSNAITASASGDQGKATVVVANDIPFIVTHAAATPNPVTTGNSTALSVLGGDHSYSESALTYHWSTTDTHVTLSNAATSNSAKNVTATFSQAGTYHFSVTVANPTGASVQDAVVVTVNQGFGKGVGSIVVSPNPGSVGPTKTLTFSAVAYDQFSNPLVTQPSFAWAASAGGAISTTSGLFTAGNAPGTFTNAISASADGDTGKATVTVLTDTPILVSVTANPNPVTTTTSTSLAALASDTDYPESTLTYHWSTTNSNVTLADTTTSHAAKNTTATFTQAGLYVFTVTAANPTGASAQQTINVIVDQGFGNGVGSIVINPNPGTTGPGQTLAFNAVAYDQFGKALAIQPTFTWSASAGGAIASTGQFTAGNVPGTYSNAITATASGDHGQATVVVSNDAPTVAKPATATPNPVTTGTTTALSVLGADALYPESALTYQWTTPNLNVSLSNGTKSNAAKNTVATFTQAGTYSFTATITNPTGASVQSSVTVVVQQGFGQGVGSIRISPPSTTLAPTKTQPFTATAYDQFGNTLASQPTFTWSVTSGGAVDAHSGLYTAGNTPGTYSDSVVATANGDRATASVLITSDVPTVARQAAANPNPVINAYTTALTVLGADPVYSESSLKYHWTAADPNVTLSDNGNTSNDKNLTATFSTVGIYHLVVTITNPTGASVQSFVDVTVETQSGPGGGTGIDHIVVSPDGETIRPTDTLQFVAKAYDASNQLIPNVTFSWNVSSVAARVSGAGLFSPSSNLIGSQLFTVTATSGGRSGVAHVTVEAPAPSQTGDICGAHAYPVPYKASMNIPGITFTGLAAGAKIRIFTTDGKSVQTLYSQQGENVVWPLTNSDGEKVASWVYLYIITHGGACDKKDGKLVIIR